MRVLCCLVTAALLLAGCGAPQTHDVEIGKGNGRQGSGETDGKGLDSGGSPQPQPQPQPQPEPAPVPSVMSVDAKAFNALLLWRDGSGAPLFSYPEHYDAAEGEVAADGLFFVDQSDYWAGDIFTGKPTEGVQIEEGNRLVYPVRDGRGFQLLFSPESSLRMGQRSALKFCSDRGERLPTIRELFDFCATGAIKVENSYTQSPCSDLWSLSLFSHFPTNAWLFYAGVGNVSYDYRNSIASVRCVSAVR